MLQRGSRGPQLQMLSLVSTELIKTVICALSEKIKMCCLTNQITSGEWGWNGSQFLQNYTAHSQNVSNLGSPGALGVWNPAPEWFSTAFSI